MSRRKSISVRVEYEYNTDPGSSIYRFKFFDVKEKISKIEEWLDGEVDEVYLDCKVKRIDIKFITWPKQVDKL